MTQVTLKSVEGDRVTLLCGCRYSTTDAGSFVNICGSGHLLDIGNFEQYLRSGAARGDAH